MGQEKRPRVITTRVTEAEGERLDEMAARDRRAVAELGYFAIQEYIARRKAGAPVTPVLDEAPSLGPADITPEERMLVGIFRSLPADMRPEALAALHDIEQRPGKARPSPQPAHESARERKGRR